MIEIFAALSGLERRPCVLEGYGLQAVRLSIKKDSALAAEGRSLSG